MSLHRFMAFAAVLLLPTAFSARAADQSGSTNAEAKRLVRNLLIPQLFAEERLRYLQFHREHGAREGLIKIMGERLIAVDFETPLTAFVAKQFSVEHLGAINEYLSSGTGKRMQAEFHQIYREMQAVPPGTFNIDVRMKKFKDTLTSTERKAIEQFGKTAAGAEYWAKVPLVDKEFHAIFSRLVKEMLERLAAEADAAEKKSGPLVK